MQWQPRSAASAQKPRHCGSNTTQAPIRRGLLRPRPRLVEGQHGLVRGLVPANRRRGADARHNVGRGDHGPAGIRPRVGRGDDERRAGVAQRGSRRRDELASRRRERRPRPILADFQAAFMASPPHRANILTPKFFEAGVGVVWDGGGYFYVAVLFRQATTAAAPPPAPAEPNPPSTAAEPKRGPGPLAPRAARRPTFRSRRRRVLRRCHRQPRCRRRCRPSPSPLRIPPPWSGRRALVSTGCWRPQRGSRSPPRILTMGRAPRWWWRQVRAPPTRTVRLLPFSHRWRSS